MYKISETRKEDELYFKGPFWVAGISKQEIENGNYIILSEKELCTYDGNLNRNRSNRKEQTHQYVWDSKFKKEFNVPYNYYPRGRVDVYKGKAYININSFLNKPKLINDILHEFEIDKLNYEVYEIDKLQQDGHYDFMLK